MWILIFVGLYILLKKIWFPFWVCEVWFSTNCNNLTIVKTTNGLPIGDVKLNVQYLKNNTCILVGSIPKT